MKVSALHSDRTAMSPVNDQVGRNVGTKAVSNAGLQTLKLSIGSTPRIFRASQRLRMRSTARGINLSVVSFKTEQVPKSELKVLQATNSLL